MAIRTGRVRYFRTDVPSNGADVVTFDNKRLGTIKDGDDDYFQVEGRWRRDYWLSSVLIRNCEPGRVTLHVSRDSLGRYKLDRPGNGRGSDHSGAEAARGKTPTLTSIGDGSVPRTSREHTEKEHTPMKFRIRWPIAFVAVGLMSLGLLAAACEDDDTTDDDPFGTPTGGNGFDDTNGFDDDGLDGTDDGLDGGTNGTMSIDGIPGGGTAVFTMAGLQGPSAA